MTRNDGTVYEGEFYGGERHGQARAALRTVLDFDSCFHRSA